MLIIVVSFSACREKIEVGSFSFSEDSIYWSTGLVESKTNGFKNTSKGKMIDEYDALELAKNEITISYDSVAVYFDDVELMWKVAFFTKGQDEKNYNVYMNEYGQTQICTWKK